jgi:hypothetical protein
MSDNRTDYKSADAIIFHYRDFDWTTPALRTPNQRYIYMLMESPPHTYNLNRISGNNTNFFNWTMTYRQDSDILLSYFHVRKKVDVVSKDVWRQVGVQIQMQI